MGISNHLSPTRRPDRVSENEESHLLVSDPKKYIYSSLFNEVYLLSQFPLDHRRQWSGEEGQFNSFFESFLSFSQGISKKEMALWDHNQTIENWIIPLLTILGWTKSPGSNGGNDNILLNTSVEVVDELGKKSKLSPSILVAESTKGRDIIEGSKGAETVTNIRNHSLITVTTDYFNAWSDVRSGNYDHARNATFVSTDQNRLLGINDQSTSYLGFFEHPWAISTDGYTWRLYSQDSSILNSDVYFEFKVGRIFDDLRTGFIEDGDESAITSLKLFYWLFSKEGLAQGALSIGTKALAKSNLYFKDLEDDLKGRFIHAITILSNDILTRAKVKNVKDEVLYKLVRNTSESLIFTLLFLRSCESRRVIPLNQKFLPYSVSNLIRKIRYYDPTEDIHLNFERLNFNLTHLFGTAISPDGFEIFEYFLRLKDIIQKGTENKYDFGFKIEGFKESIFEREETQILNDNKVTNGAFVDLLFTLFYEVNSNKAQEIPFESFTPRHLGSIFESFLEYKVSPATSDVYLVKESNNGKVLWSWNDVKRYKGKAANALASRLIKEGQVVYRSGSEDRKASGAYYTPDYIVQYIVENTLRPIVANKSPEEILKIKVCDPAMGSGHFLLSALNFLTRSYLKASSNKSNVKSLVLPEVKRTILDSCIFGADINSSAVKLAKMSLWLETAYINIKLERLRDQLVQANSLSRTNMPTTLFEGLNGSGFDAVIGNPPWGSVTFNLEEVDEEIQDKVDGNNLNSFDLFTRVAFSWLNSKGRLGFLIPRNFIRKSMYSSLREYLLPNLELLGDVGLFPGVMQEACILVASKSSKLVEVSMDSSLRDHGVNWVQHFSDEKTNFVSKKAILGPEFLFQFEQSSDLENIIAKLNTQSFVGSYLSASRGIECGKKGEFVKCPSCAVYTTPPKKKNKLGKFEKVCKCGQKITLKNKIIEIISSEKKTPKHKPIIVGPDIKPGKFAASKYIITGLNGVNYKKSLFKSEPKIYIPMNNNKITAALNKNGEVLATKTVYVVRAKEKGLPWEFFEKLFNSDIVNFYFSYKVIAGGEFTNSISTDDVAKLPVPNLDKKKMEAISKSKNFEADLAKAFNLSNLELSKIEKYLNKGAGNKAA